MEKKISVSQPETAAELLHTVVRTRTVTVTVARGGREIKAMVLKTSNMCPGRAQTGAAREERGETCHGGGPRPRQSTAPTPSPSGRWPPVGARMRGGQAAGCEGGFPHSEASSVAGVGASPVNPGCSGPGDTRRSLPCMLCRG